MEIVLSGREMYRKGYLCSAQEFSTSVVSFILKFTPDSSIEVAMHWEFYT